MQCEDTSARLVDYLSGELAGPERLEFQSHLESCPACKEELDRTSQLWRQLGDIPAASPDSLAMRARFEAMLAAPLPQRVQRRTWVATPWLQACAALLLLVVGIEVGRELRPAPTAPSEVRELSLEVRNLRQMVSLSLMQQQSASERLKGVSWSSQLDRPGNEVVTALIDTLMHDANVNVRLASIDALKRFAERAVVRSAAINALDTQRSPLVQMALIDFVVETQERGALAALRRLSRDDTVNEAVRARAAWGISHLETAA